MSDSKRARAVIIIGNPESESFALTRAVMDRVITEALLIPCARLNGLMDAPARVSAEAHKEIAAAEWAKLKERFYGKG